MMMIICIPELSLFVLRSALFRFAINLKTAKALGIETPNSNLVQADE